MREQRPPRFIGSVIMFRPACNNRYTSKILVPAPLAVGPTRLAKGNIPKFPTEDTLADERSNPIGQKGLEIVFRSGWP